MKHVECSIKLPRNIKSAEVKGLAYSGPVGSQEKSYTFTYDNKGIFHFICTRPLDIGEGFTIAIGFPKGHVALTGLFEEYLNFGLHETGTMVALGGLVFFFLYNCIVWALVGRDPARKKIVDQPDPPDGISPAAARYIMRMCYDDKCLVSALLDLAVKKKIIISRDGDMIILTRSENSKTGMTRDERVLFHNLFRKHPIVKLDEKNSKIINTAVENFRATLEDSYNNNYFSLNRKYLIPDIFFGAATLFAATISHSARIGFTPSLLICGWLIIIFFIMLYLARKWLASSTIFFREGSLRTFAEFSVNGLLAILSILIFTAAFTRHTVRANPCRRSGHGAPLVSVRIPGKSPECRRTSPDGQYRRLQALPVIIE